MIRRIKDLLQVDYTITTRDDVGSTVKFELPIPGVPRVDDASNVPDFAKMKTMVASYFTVVPSVDPAMNRDVRILIEQAFALIKQNPDNKEEILEAFQKKMTKTYVDRFIAHLQNIHIDYDSDEVVRAMMCTNYLQIFGARYNEKIWTKIYNKYN